MTLCIVLVNSLPVFVDTLILEFVYGSYSRGYKFMNIRGYSHLFSLFFKIILGVWLLVGSRGIAKFVRSIHQEE